VSVFGTCRQCQRVARLLVLVYLHLVRDSFNCRVGRGLHFDLIGRRLIVVVCVCTFYVCMCISSFDMIHEQVIYSPAQPCIVVLLLSPSPACPCGGATVNGGDSDTFVLRFAEETEAQWWAGALRACACGWEDAPSSQTGGAGDGGRSYWELSPQAHLSAQGSGGARAILTGSGAADGKLGREGQGRVRGEACPGGRHLATLAVLDVRAPTPSPPVSVALSIPRRLLSSPPLT